LLALLSRCGTLTDLPFNFVGSVLGIRPSTEFLRRFERKIVMSTVKFFNSSRGYGFIQPDGGSPDVFVHITAVERAGLRSLIEGQKVSFDLVKDARSGKSSAENLLAV
jgi:CspA family cold shock protein